jgi:hypothetical protein
VPPGPQEKQHLRDLGGPLYHDAEDCAEVRVTHRCLSLRGRPAATRSLRRAMRGFQLSLSWKALAEHKAQNNSDRPNKEREALCNLTSASSTTST